MVRAGVLALQYYTPQKGWGQAHMQARYCILQVLLEAGQGFVTIHRGDGDQSSGNGSFVNLNSEQIMTVGQTAIGTFLTKLQVYKSTGDIGAAKVMYDAYTAVDGDMLSLRQEVVDNRKPRKMLVQHSTSVNDGDVTLKTFPASAEGLVQSFIERISTNEKELMELWKADKDVLYPI